MNLDAWKARWTANARRADGNAMMDSGWSERAARACDREALALLLELVRALAAVPTEPADFFDRPALAECMEAARHVDR